MLNAIMESRIHKVAIIGGAPTTQDQRPGDDYEIWVHGNQMDRHQDKKVDKIFEIHDDLSEHDDIYPQWLVDKNIPMVVGEKFPIKAKHVEVFPFKEANALMDQQLTSTPAYMMAYAMLKGATHISIYGVDMSVDDHEYFYQRPSMYGWIGYAKAKGVEIEIPEKSTLFKEHHIEGKDSGGKPNFALVPFTESEFLQMAEEHNNKIRQLEAAIQTHNGSRQSYLQMARVARAIESGHTIDSLTKQTRVK